MKRSAQMRRTPIKPKGYGNEFLRRRAIACEEKKPYPPAIIVRDSSDTRAVGRYTHTGAFSVVSVPKRDYVRSPTLIANCRGIACQHCGMHLGDGTVYAAHSNWEVHGKGGHIKADDNRVAALCNEHHAMLDQGSKMTEAERKAFWWRAHVRTVKLLWRLGKWPPEVPVPNVGVFPW